MTRILGVLAAVVTMVGLGAQDRGRPDRKLLPTQLSKKIDSIVHNRWLTLRLNPAPPADDYEFLRRVYIDVVGRAPTYDETLEFIKSNDKLKRERKIEQLIESEEFIEHWSDVWANFLYGYNNAERSDRGLLKDWLAEQLKNGTPYHKLVRELLTAKGKHTENKAANFILRWLENDRPDELIKRVSRVFLGIRLNCASCHDHPLDIWKQEHFYGMAAFFYRTTWRQIGKDDDPDKHWVVEDDYKNAKNIKYRPQGFTKAMGPTFLDGRPAASDMLREDFANMLVSNPQFARAIANRIWAHFFGRGIVDPMDDFTMKNKPVIPDLLDELAREFRENNFDFKYMVRSIANTKIYQQSSKLPPQKDDKTEAQAAQLWAHMPLKVLPPRVLFNTIAASTKLDHTDRFSKARELNKLRNDFVRLLADNFEDEFADPREFNTSVQQLMRLMTWNDLYAGLAPGGGGIVTKILRDVPADKERIRHLYLAILVREPSEKEMQTCVQYLEKNGNSDAAYAEIGFALMNTSEFFFNH